MKEKISEKNFETARLVAFRYLGYSARSQSEIEQRLAKDEYPPAIIAEVLIELEALGLTNDEKFAQSWVDSRGDRKKYGKQRLANELRNRGVEKETIQQALENVDEEDEFQRALAAARQKFRPEKLALLESTQLQAEKRKCANFLQRRGFSWALITKVLSAMVSNNE